MAASITPRFIASGLGLGVSFTALVTSVSAGTGATDVVTGGTDESKVVGILFSIAGTPQPTVILVYHDSAGTKRLVGSVRIPSELAPPSFESQPYVIQWTNPDTQGSLKSGHKYCAGAISGSNVIHATPLGGSYS